MEVKSNLDFDQIVRSDLPAENLAGARDEVMMEVCPRVILFQVRIHSRKWGRHGLSSCSPRSQLWCLALPAIVLMAGFAARKTACRYPSACAGMRIASTAISAPSPPCRTKTPSPPRHSVQT